MQTIFPTCKGLNGVRTLLEKLAKITLGAFGIEPLIPSTETTLHIK